jgi:hypothetical protein
MAVPGIEHSVAALESEVARLKEELKKAVPSQGDWLDAFSGVFDNDPVYEEAMRLGREYRESLRPEPRGKQSKRAQPAKAKRQ